MEKENVFKMIHALGLERDVVGVHFLAYRQEYEESSYQAFPYKRSFCGMVNFASRGEVIKVKGDNFACMGGAQSLGILDEPEATKSGRIYSMCGLYGSLPIARSVNDSMQHIQHKMFGLEIGPLDQLEKADIVIMIGTAKQMMRIIQGYTHEYGPAKNLSTVGNQAMCSDLVAKTFSNNDINFSFMCAGARNNTQCDDGEMGVGLPIQMFSSLTQGVLATLNVVETNKVKKEILKNLPDALSLGFPIEMDVNYGKNAEKYQRYCLEMLADEGEYPR